MLNHPSLTALPTSQGRGNAHQKYLLRDDENVDQHVYPGNEVVMIAEKLPCIIRCVTHASVSQSGAMQSGL